MEPFTPQTEVVDGFYLSFEDFMPGYMTLCANSVVDLRTHTRFSTYGHRLSLSGRIPPEVGWVIFEKTP